MEILLITLRFLAHLRLCVERLPFGFFAVQNRYVQGVYDER